MSYSQVSQTKSPCEACTSLVVADLGFNTPTEIRELDGERQSLVYNHHHELIEASDTIRKAS